MMLRHALPDPVDRGTVSTMPMRLALTLAFGLTAAPALAGAPLPMANENNAATTARPISEAVEIGVGGYYGQPYGYRHRYGHWGYPSWFYDPWPRTVYYGPPRRTTGYPPPQPLWTGAAVVWLHPAPPVPAAP